MYLQGSPALHTHSVYHWAVQIHEYVYIHSTTSMCDALHQSQEKPQKEDEEDGQGKEEEKETKSQGNIRIRAVFN